MVSLEPLTAAGAHRIEHWFDHPEVGHRLGGRFWIHRELKLLGQRPGGTFRGATVLRSHGWVAVDGAGTPVAFIGGDNAASLCCARAAGFRLADPRPDHEGMVFCRRER